MRYINQSILYFNIPLDISTPTSQPISWLVQNTQASQPISWMIRTKRNYNQNPHTKSLVWI